MQAREERAERRIRQGTLDHLATTFAQILLLGTVIWVSERQLRQRLIAEAETRRAVGRARLIVETVREPIAVISADLAILQANRRSPISTARQRSPRGSLPEVRGWGDNPALLQRLRDVAADRREMWDYETTSRPAGRANRAPRRRQRAADGAARPRRTPSILLTVSDITARKQSEEQVLELNRQLEGKVAQISESNRELEAFSYSVSHDLRAPLRHIAGFAEKLQRQLGDDADDKTRHYSEVVVELVAAHVRADRGPADVFAPRPPRDAPAGGRHAVAGRGSARRADRRASRTATSSGASRRCRWWSPTRT